MADDFLLVEVVNRDRGNPRPDGTRLITSGRQLEEIQEYLDQKCGRAGVVTTDELIADGGQDGGSND